ncbi:response regulator [Asticcacaulis sp. 201]|uniref:response regulator n=1 Tax=Asticcacaulis sp. 201 TaxID=3028787 RepID=UPI0029168ECD|nr:response regulator [Asticcacaulis sp. 201]MDV6332791.1 response regulator [Asticcacaulis sp. 201]
MKNLLIREGRAAEIMLVEDNRGDALLASRAFKQAEIDNNVTVAETGEKALTMLRREGQYATMRLPDLILLDLNLPMMSGHEVLAAIKGDEALRHIPVIIMSSSSAETDIAGGYANHASAYVVKPISLDSFTEVVRNIEQFFFMLAVLPSSE